MLSRIPVSPRSPTLPIVLDPIGDDHDLVLRLADALVLLAVLSLPLTSALTIDVRFPLKIYEPSLALAALLRVAARSSRVKWQRFTTPFILMASFIAAGFASLLYAVHFQGGRPADSHVYRYGATSDGFLQLAYVGLAVVAMVLVSDLGRRRRDIVIRFWLRGALGASLYAIYLNAGDLLNVSLPELPGTSSQVGYLSGHVFHRAGTFLEGNFFALYLFVAAVLALSANRVRTAGVLTVAMALTLSPINLAALMVLWFVYAVTRLRNQHRWSVTFLVAWPLLLAFAVGPGWQFAKAVTEKVRDPASQSSVERTGTAAAALGMFRDHPIAGVGISQYSLWFPVYRSQSVPSYYLTGDIRFIPNNVYAQVAAEVGVIGLLPFVAFLSIVIRRAAASRVAPIIAGTLGVVALLNSFPSVSTIFLWAFFGFVLGLEPDEHRNPSALHAPTRS